MNDTNGTDNTPTLIPVSSGSSGPRRNTPPRIKVAPKPVVIESPLLGKLPVWLPTWLIPAWAWWARWSNHRFALACVRHSALVMGEAPYASHVMFGQALNDADPHERRVGMELGFRWGAVAETRVVYCDRGVSSGMAEGIAQRPAGQIVEYRYLDPRLAVRCEVCGVAIAPGMKRCHSGVCLTSNRAGAKS